MILLIVSILGTAGALLTLLMTLVNLRLYRPAPAASDPSDGGAGPKVSVCIPARNEEKNIEACVRSLLTSERPDIEVLVYDDESSDSTADILARLCAEDRRVRRVPTRPLLPGWNGKQHACFSMGMEAGGEWLLFTDADVRFEPDAVGRAVAFADQGGADLVSTFPRQVVGSVGEALLVPSIFFILFSYLPFSRMRRTSDPQAVAGCGQFILAKAGAYRTVGGHGVCRNSMHDGIMLPRAFRRHGLKTDLFDGTGLCSVRMYSGFIASWRGFAKNAFEGLGSVGLLVFLTLFHAVAHVLPWGVVAAGALTRPGPATGFAFAAVLIAMVQRGVLVVRFRHPLWLAFAHPIAILLMIGVQWHSLAKHLAGTRSWKGRVMSMGPTENAAGTPRRGPSGHGELVVLVDEHDDEIGTMEKLAAHTDGGRLHRAISVFLLDSEGRVMLQKRAAGKYHFGGLWTNTCCSHPRPGETPARAGRRRLIEEMGIDAEVRPVSVFLYRATDERTGLTEHELDHVLIGRFDGEPVLNEDEAEDWRWATPEQIDRELDDSPECFTPWFSLAWEEMKATRPQ